MSGREVNSVYLLLMVANRSARDSYKVLILSFHWANYVSSVAIRVSLYTIIVAICVGSLSPTPACLSRRVLSAVGEGIGEKKGLKMFL